MFGIRDRFDVGCRRLALQRRTTNIGRFSDAKPVLFVQTNKTQSPALRCRATLLLLRRANAKEAKPLVSDLLHDPTPLQAEQKYVLMLRPFDPTIPVPTSGDDCLRMLTTMFRQKPEQFHFSLVQAQLLPIRDRFKLTPQEVQYLKDASENRSGEWIMLTKQDRQRGYKAALQWLDEMK